MTWVKGQKHPWTTYNSGKGEAYRWLMAHVSYEGDDCLIWPFARKDTGYGQFGYKGKVYRAHRYMCEVVHGPAPEGHVATHECGNGSKGCVNPRHLKWKTPSENERDKQRHGTAGAIRKGEKRKRLTPQQVIEIRSLIGKVTDEKIAARFGITRGNVYHIKAGKTWSGVTP